VEAQDAKPTELQILRDGKTLTFQLPPGMVGILLEDRAVAPSAAEMKVPH
jgi:hypothetical protein